MKRYFIFLSSAVLILMSDMLANDNDLSFYLFAVDLMPSLAAVWWLSSSFSEMGGTKWIFLVVCLCDIVLMSYHLCRMAGFAGIIPDSHSVNIVSAIAAGMILLLSYGLSGTVADIKSIMKNGSVWMVVCLVVDVMYFLFMISAVAFVQCSLPVLGVLIIIGAVIAIGIRELYSYKFIIWQRQERIIVESMKVASLPSATDGLNVEDIYKELYERIVVYFDSKKPYLDNELTINTLVRDLYSNKVYISKAISLFTGRNFCQFVNYYRVSYSMECFRTNPELRVHDLALMSGFNSVVSYNMAFRLFMSVTPGEWCKKEKRALMKKK